MVDIFFLFIFIIIYSLIVEKDKIALFDSFSVLFNKEAYLDSFFGQTNVFGHTLFFGVLSFVALAFLSKHYLLILPSFLLCPFIVFSTCRAAMVSTFLTYLFIFIYIYTRSYFKKKWLFFLLSLILFSLLVVIFIDSTIYNFIKFEVGENEYISLYSLIEEIFNTLVAKRFNLIENILPNLIENILPIYTFKDYIFGFGYGISFLLARTYNRQAYYMHNSLFEIYFQGGIPYLIFLFGLYFYVFYRVIRYTRKAKEYKILGYFLIISFSTGIYGLYESMPILFNDLDIVRC